MLTTINISKKIIIGIPFIFIIAVIFIVSAKDTSKTVPQENSYVAQYDNKIFNDNSNNNAENLFKENKKFKYSELLINHAIEVPILLYHHIAKDVTSTTMVSPETFENHIKALAGNGYTGISFEEIVAYVEDSGELPPKPIIITFDDGYLSNYEFAYPILQKYNMKATIFIIGVSVGKDTYRDTGDSDYTILPRFNYEQANEMIESGLISIQSHSYDMHQWEPFEQSLNSEYRDGILPLENESHDEYIKNFKIDCELAKTELEFKTQTQLIAYSYPQGKFIKENEDILCEMGIKATVTIYYGSNFIVRHMPETLYNLRRLNIDEIPAEKLLEILETKKTVISEE